MRVVAPLILALFLLLGLRFSSIAQETEKKLIEIKIQTSAQCGMCKTRIEKAMAYEKGVKSATLDTKDAVLTVEYKNWKTTAEDIRKAISLVGYDADTIPADAKAYGKLPACCKKPDDPAHKKMEE